MRPSPPPDWVRSPACRDYTTVTGPFDFVGAQVPLVLPDETAAQSAFHRPKAAMAEIDHDTPVPVVLLLAEFVEPPIHDWWNAALLRSGHRMP